MLSKLPGLAIICSRVKSLRLSSTEPACPAANSASPDGRRRTSPRLKRLAEASICHRPSHGKYRDHRSCHGSFGTCVSDRRRGLVKAVSSGRRSIYPGAAALDALEARSPDNALDTDARPLSRLKEHLLDVTETGTVGRARSETDRRRRSLACRSAQSPKPDASPFSPFVAQCRACAMAAAYVTRHLYIIPAIPIIGKALL